MEKIKNMTLENEQIQSKLTQEKTQRIENYEALKAEISTKVTLQQIKNNYDPTI